MSVIYKSGDFVIFNDNKPPNLIRSMKFNQAYLIVESKEGLYNILDHNSLFDIRCFTDGIFKDSFYFRLSDFDILKKVAINCPTAIKVRAFIRECIFIRSE